jgi:ArsR family transcriptional regulator
MDETAIILAFAALAQATRLQAFRVLVASEPAGLAAGEIARRLAAPHNTMSSHLGVLARAGLVTAERHSRSIVYRANLDRARDVVTFLLKDCCGGHPETCSAVIDALASCCPKEVSCG